VGICSSHAPNWESSVLTCCRETVFARFRQALRSEGGCVGSVGGGEGASRVAHMARHLWGKLPAIGCEVSEASVGRLLATSRTIRPPARGRWRLARKRARFPDVPHPLPPKKKSEMDFAAAPRRSDALPGLRPSRPDVVGESIIAGCQSGHAAVLAVSSAMSPTTQYLQDPPPRPFPTVPPPCPPRNSSGSADRRKTIWWLQVSAASPPCAPGNSHYNDAGSSVPLTPVALRVMCRWAGNIKQTNAARSSRLTSFSRSFFPFAGEPFTVVFPPTHAPAVAGRRAHPQNRHPPVRPPQGRISGCPRDSAQ